jgi:hypothetical protein
MDKFGQDVTAIITAIIGVAIVAVVLSNGANTVNVLWSFFQGMAGLLSVAISPITGQSVTSGGTLTAGWSNTGVNGFGVGTNGTINSITGSVNSASALITAGTNGIMNGASAVNALSSLFGGSSGLSNTTGIMSGASDAAGTAVTGIVNNGMLAGI